jgi:hypothetical protein
MTTIRKAIIEIETRTKRTKIEAPDISAAEKAFQAEAAAAGEASKAIQGANVARREAGESARVFANESRPVIDDFHRRTVNAFNEGGEAAFRFGRGLALVSASSEKDMQVIVRNVALAQGAFDVFAGGSKALTTIGAAFGPIGVGIAGVTLAVGAGAIAWRKYTAELEEVAKAEREARDALREHDRELTRLGSRRIAGDVSRQRALADLGISNALTPAERLRRIEREQNRVRGSADLFGREAADLESRTFRRRGSNFGEASPELQGALDKFGGFGGIRDRIAILTEQRAEGLERLIELERQEVSAKTELLQRSPQQNGLFAVLPGGAQAALDAAVEGVLQQSQRTLDRLFKLYEEAESKAEAARQKLQQIENASN